jgi:hypothetical protein
MSWCLHRHSKILTELWNEGWSSDVVATRLAATIGVRFGKSQGSSAAFRYMLDTAYCHNNIHEHMYC